MNLIEGHDGAPLPDALQRDSSLYTDLKEFWVSNPAMLSLDDLVVKMMIVIEPHWPREPKSSTAPRIVCPITGRSWPMAKIIDIKTCMQCTRKIDVDCESWRDGPLCSVCSP